MDFFGDIRVGTALVSFIIMCGVIFAFILIKGALLDIFSFKNKTKKKK